jgi:hypothetical protein
MDAEFGGSIRVNGQPVLSSVGTYSVGGATITYDNQGELVDQAASKYPKNVVHLSLPEGIQMEVFRWGNWIDMRIQMAPLAGGQDGSCGNFNGLAADDTTVAILDRVGSRVGPGDCLFTRHLPIDFSRPMQAMLATCPSDQRNAARDKCILDVGLSDQSLVNACTFDRCFGANEHALQFAKTLATQQELMDGSLLNQ